MLVVPQWSEALRLSVSLPDGDVAILDEFVGTAGLASRSAALRHVVRMLRPFELEQEDEVAWTEWGGSDDHRAWEAAVADGVADAAR